MRGVDGPFHVGGGEGLAVVEAHAGLQMEDVRGGVGLVPALGEPRLGLIVLILLHQRIEDEHIDALRLHIEADAGIEIDRAGLDERDGGVGIGLSAAAGD